MTSIKTIKSAINESIDHAKIKMEALKQQAAATEAKVDEKIEEQRKAVVKAAGDLGDHLKEIGASANEVGEEIKAKVDNVDVQVALGKMECKDSAQKAKEEVAKYAHEFEQSIEKAKAIEDEKLEQVKSKFADYMTKMSEFKANVEAKVEAKIESYKG